MWGAHVLGTELVEGTQGLAGSPVPAGQALLAHVVQVHRWLPPSARCHPQAKRAEPGNEPQRVWPAQLCQLRCTALHLVKLRRKFPSKLTRSLQNYTIFLLNPPTSATYKNKGQILSTHEVLGAHPCPHPCVRTMRLAPSAVVNLGSAGTGADPHSDPRCSVGWVQGPLFPSLSPHSASSSFF